MRSSLLGRRAFLGGTAGVLGTVLFAPAVAAEPLGLYDIALAALERHGSAIPFHDVVAVADFSKPSADPRFHLVDIHNRSVESFLVAHGRGSDPAHRGWLTRFSNDPGSYCTSEGAYLTGDLYSGAHGRSRRVFGLDPSNSNAAPRAIVIHSARYVSDAIARDTGLLGRSEGCFAVSEQDIARVLERLGSGRLLLAGRY